MYTVCRPVIRDNPQDVVSGLSHTGGQSWYNYFISLIHQYRPVGKGGTHVNSIVSSNLYYSWHVRQSKTQISELIPSLIRICDGHSMGSQIGSMIMFLQVEEKTDFDLILYVPSTVFQLCRDMSSWVEPVLC